MVEAELTKPYVTDGEITRYSPPRTDACLIYPYRDDGTLIPEKELKEQYPKAYQYLLANKDTLSNRGSENQSFKSWYAHWRPRHPLKFERTKILISQIVKQGQSTYDNQGDLFFSSTVYSPLLTDNYRNIEFELLGILNSSLVWYYITQTGTVLRGGYYRYKTEYLEPINIPVVDFPDTLEANVQNLLNFTDERVALNTNLIDYFGSYTEGPTLPDIGIYQAPKGVGDSIITATKDDYENLRVGEVTCEREDEGTIMIQVAARYKPANDGIHETDQWGYTETELMPAMRLTDLSKPEADLVEAFVPVAVKEAGGFANFRETATKTNSLVDRLKALTLPDPDDVADDFNRYMDSVERAEELDEKIETLDQLIDEIVYELYGLTDEEIEIVEEAVADD